MGENDETEDCREVEEVDPREARKGVGRWSCPSCVHAWAAGLFDGEGCITLYPQHKRSGNTTWRITLRMTLKRKEPLEKLYELYGGLLTTTKRKWGTYHLWIFQNTPQLSEILEGWLPFLVEKRSQAVVGLEFCRFISARMANGVYSKMERERCSRWEKRLKDLKHGK